MNIKEKVKRGPNPYWKVADKIGIAESTLIRWLRQPEKLAQDKVKMIEKALDKLEKEGK